MSTITKERIELFIKSPLKNGLTRGEQMELARIALASLEAEKVTLYRERNPYNGMTTGWQELTEQEYEFVKDNASENAEFRTVYTAPPAPVVPAALPENDDEDGQDIDYLEPSEVYALGRTAGWNACRAAMLQGKSEQPQNAQQNIPENIPGGNSPVTPDGWISCSERMPEETGDIIVVSDGIVMSGISYSRRDGFYMAALEYDDDEPIDGVTHWMPLPEPPQEVNGG